MYRKWPNWSVQKGTPTIFFGFGNSYKMYIQHAKIFGMKLLSFLLGKKYYYDEF
jgi:hypothetical protein